MKFCAIVSKGLEDTAQQEILEILSHIKVPGISKHKQELTLCPASSPELGDRYSSIIFNLEDFSQAIYLLEHAQSFRRFGILVDSFKEAGSFSPQNCDFSWNSFLTKDLSFKIEVENLKGQDHRLELTRKILFHLTPFFDQKFGCRLKYEPKNADITFLALGTDSCFHLCLLFCSKELNSRRYRVFPHSASFKGDLAYHFVRYSGFQPQEKLLLGFMKDGAIAIEAVFYSKHLLLSREGCSYHQFPIFGSSELSTNNKLNNTKGKFEQNIVKSASSKKNNIKDLSSEEPNIIAFDESSSNFIASGKNATIAGIKNLLTIRKMPLDELDTRYKENEFDCAVFHLTKKDEERINEIYYQLSYVLKPSGRVLFISRDKFELSLSSKFLSVKKELLPWGEGTYQLIVLKKKSSSKR